MAIFTLSFYKAPKKVIEELNKLQSNFLWGGSEGNWKTHWVSWKDLCLPVEKGGLGFRNLEDFNKALLLKWNWRIFGETNSIWFRFLKARYVDVKLRATFCNGCSISFWYAHWLKEGILKDLFLELFNISLLKDASIGAMGGWKDGCWNWSDLGIVINAQPRREQAAAFSVLAAAPSMPYNSVAEAASSFTNGAERGGLSNSAMQMVPSIMSQAELLKSLLLNATLCADRQDSASWAHELSGFYSIASCCYGMNRRHSPFGPTNHFDYIFKEMWKAEVPLKVKAFGWRCFLNKIPTKDLLVKRGIILASDVKCVLCEETIETLFHSFFNCRYVETVWMEMVDWI
ncbi:uncharacterized protein LOC131619403 [Vicia villosa]|uniref:uncharacterized protein LOC131619403 n=1 Tax=Vicia villosa TaxID=3911 RepID=UPI00273B3E5A|nr:uncharacterized protein LOC131619403 [Vicia villosa]